MQSTLDLSGGPPRELSRPPRGRPSRRLEAALWSAQGLLGGVFAVAGAAKLVAPMRRLAHLFGWPGVVGPGLTRVIGAAELAGAVGVVVPSATRLAPRLTPLAASALDVVMLLAVGYHVGRRERARIPQPLLLAALATFVAWGRLGPGRLAPRR